MLDISLETPFQFISRDVIYNDIESAWLSGRIACARDNTHDTITDVIQGGSKFSDLYMWNVAKLGIYTRFAINWCVSNCTIYMSSYTQGTYAIWLDTWSEGSMWDSVFTGGGDAGLRATNTVLGGYRPPTEHQFHKCSFDEGGRACIWLTQIHRSTFVGCWASSQIASLTAAVVIDNVDVRRFHWSDGTIFNVLTHGILISEAESFSIVNSTFASWGLAAANSYYGITVASTTGVSSATRHMNFQITGNTFFNDPDAASSGCWVGVGIQWWQYNKYVVANNIGHGSNGLGGLTSSTVIDSAAAWNAKSVGNNL